MTWTWRDRLFVVERNSFRSGLAVGKFAKANEEMTSHGKTEEAHRDQHEPGPRLGDLADSVGQIGRTPKACPPSGDCGIADLPDTVEQIPATADFPDSVWKVGGVRDSADTVCRILPRGGRRVFRGQSGIIAAHVVPETGRIADTAADRISSRTEFIPFVFNAKRFSPRSPLAQAINVMIEISKTERNEFRSTTNAPNRPPFVPFNEHVAVRIYRRNLPHWRQGGATYFVTFRLGDSVPRKVLDQWEYEKEHWLHARGIQATSGDWQSQLKTLPERDQEQFHKHFNRLFHAALDQGHGKCYLKDGRCLATVRKKLLERDGDSYHLGDFVIMPNHVHLLIVPGPGIELERVLKSIKGAASRESNQHLGRTGQFWQPDSYDHIVRKLDNLFYFRQYIKDNPGKAGIDLPPEALYHAEWMDASFS